MSKDPNNESSKPSGKRRRYVFRWLLAVTVCLLGLAIVIHLGAVNKLNSSRDSIAIGDTRASVERLLGKCSMEYFTGFPDKGGPPEIYGAAYGSLINQGRLKIDSVFYTVFGVPGSQTLGIPDFYGRYCAQSLGNWPLLIEYDSNGIVTAVK